MKNAELSVMCALELSMDADCCIFTHHVPLLRGTPDGVFVWVTVFERT